MTGIPSFRNVLHNIVAEKNYRNLHQFIVGTLPPLLDQGRRIISKQKEDDGFFYFRQHVTALLEELTTDIDAAVSSSMESLLPPMWDYGIRSCVMSNLENKVLSWSKGVHFNTYRMTIRQRGIPKDSKAKAYEGRSINWNLDLLTAMETISIERKNKRPKGREVRKPLGEWKDRVLELSNTLSVPVVSLTQDFLKRVQTTINTTSCDAALKSRTMEAWQKVVAVIRKMIDRLPAKLDRKINDVLRVITTEEDVGCMITTLNIPQYDMIASQKTGRGVYNRYKAATRNAFLEVDADGKAFIDKYEDQATGLMHGALNSGLDDFRQTITARLEEFITITQQFLESQDHKTKEYRALRSRLEAQMPDFESRVLQLQRMFPGCADQEEIEVRRFAKKIKLENN
ncbi:uncharacterized protein EI97DRAFT_474455 [Westerdykella ornata]|uniref:Uncharacterized protein n=1 Tax=Westerdykella ornata TaxID=318751 RepID=A0A6A6JGU4_WESOR|nr:uncharacterized protein EI97DRAFT_474455 [Westerdykella ornata]KAF2275870.1 hypothetical protein EI97DRAFT_474455 [Westerdykella ornata]